MIGMATKGDCRPRPFPAGRRPRKAIGAFRLMPAALVLALLAACAEPPGDYQLALQALAGEDWRRAADLLRLAADADPGERPEPIRIGSGREEPYLPHYFLGRALYEINSCLLAMDAWQESERQGVVQATRHFEDLKEYRSSCEKLILEPALQRAGEALAEAGKNAEFLEKLRAEPDLGPLWDDWPELVSAARRARERLESIRSGLEEATERRDVRRISDCAQRAARAQAGSKRLVDRIFDLARSLPGRGEEPSPPPVLLAAARAYFAGDYGAAGEVLEDQYFGDRRWSARGHLLRAAARFALYHRGGQADGELLADAAADVRVCRRLDSAQTPDAKAFSPRFRRFFEQPAP